MKDGEIDLFAQLLFENRICAYIEWLDNELIMTDNRCALPSRRCAVKAVVS